MQDLNAEMEKFHAGESDDAYRFLGCHKKGNGFLFRVWAPNAARVSVVGDFNFWNTEDLIMQRDQSGVWEVFSVHAHYGSKYKYFVTHRDGRSVYKSDPYAFSFASLPDTSGVICAYGNYTWHDGDYLRQKRKREMLRSPVNIYEVHLGSWMTREDGSLLSYTELAQKLVRYVKKMHYTHIELLPVTEYPYYGSWGYQVTGYFAPTHRHGTPEQFMSFIDTFHQNGIGVILDWVPAHFPKDEPGLYEFDGTCCYEVSDPMMNEHPEWNTRIFDYGRGEVRSFLISSALFWLREYHIDGIRVDAVASMLYLDYGRKEYRRNKFGGNYNLEAIDFLRSLNRHAFAFDKSVIMAAEESTAFPMVTKPDYDGGLGFNLKWNMGWMNDMLGYMSTDPLFRKGRHNDLTFSLTYAFSENFVLPLSHDETVHGKCSLINKMPGSYDEKFDNLRVFYAYMMAHPGKKLSFMGNEFAQFIEWNYKQGLDWLLLDYEKHKKMQTFTRELDAFYLASPQLWENDSDWDGFRWISADDAAQSVIAFRRIAKDGSELIAVLNFCPVDRRGYRLGLPSSGVYRPVFSTARARYGARSCRIPKVTAKPMGMHGYEYSGEFFIPSLSAVFYQKD